MKVTIDVYEKDAKVMARLINERTARGHKRTIKQVATIVAQNIIDNRFSTEDFDAERFVEYPKEMYE